MRASRHTEEWAFPALDPDEVRGGAAAVAQHVRQAWRLPRGPVRKLCNLLESVGAIIFLVGFESDQIDGTNLRTPGLPPMLFLNKNASGERHIFNMAHELGHLVMHFSASGGDEEKEANDFAQEFLMPKEDIRHDLRNFDLAAAVRLKPAWGVSMAALIERAFQLKLLKPDKRRRLYTQMNARGIRKQEPFPLDFQEPVAFDRLCEFHRKQLNHSDQDMRRLLFTDQLGLLECAKGSPLRLVGDTGNLFDTLSSANASVPLTGQPLPDPPALKLRPRPSRF